jgi:DNA helicase-2/ATP-dependent DNA helicase PcrA
MNDLYQARTPESLSRQENIEELINGMHDFCATRQEEGNEHVALTDYLSEVSLLTDQDNDKEGDGNKITLMTIHSAKGLEFKNVFVVGLEENLFPSPMSSESVRGLEEERRLFYVAITRAEDHCYLSFAKSRFRFGKTEFSNPSRFLKDIDGRFLHLPQSEQLVRQVDEGASRFRSQPFVNRSVEERPKVQVVSPSQSTRTLKRVSSISASHPSASTGTGALQVGNVIEHERFGIGDVVAVVGQGDNCKATVKFHNAGEKQLLLKFAKFKVIG